MIPSSYAHFVDSQTSQIPQVTRHSSAPISYPQKVEKVVSSSLPLPAGCSQASQEANQTKRRVRHHSDPPLRSGFNYPDLRIPEYIKKTSDSSTQVLQKPSPPSSTEIPAFIKPREAKSAANSDAHISSDVSDVRQADNIQHEQPSYTKYRQIKPIDIKDLIKKICKFCKQVWKICSQKIACAWDYATLVIKDFKINGFKFSNKCSFISFEFHYEPKIINVFPSSTEDIKRIINENILQA